MIPLSLLCAEIWHSRVDFLCSTGSEGKSDENGVNGARARSRCEDKTGRDFKVDCSEWGLRYECRKQGEARQSNRACAEGKPRKLAREGMKQKAGA
jgi:hypothetical protein